MGSMSCAVLTEGLGVRSVSCAFQTEGFGVTTHHRSLMVLLLHPSHSLEQQNTQL